MKGDIRRRQIIVLCRRQIPGRRKGLCRPHGFLEASYYLWRQTLKNRILLENYFFPGDLEASIEAFVDHYNHHRYHESINNLIPADVYVGRGQVILEQREKIKRKTIETRRLHYRKVAT